MYAEEDIQAELARARKKFPNWPTDPIHAAAVIAEEAGEVIKAVLEAVYEPHKGSRAKIRGEVLQTMAVCVRFLASFDAKQYEWFHDAQHDQDAEQ